MNIEVINTGGELMLGFVLNSHQQWLCRQLADLGYVVTRQIAIADTAGAICEAVLEALGRAELIIVTGGLGPTADDITRKVQGWEFKISPGKAQAILKRRADLFEGS